MSGTVQAADTGSRTVAAGTYSVAPIGFGYYPREGSRAVSLQYSWSFAQAPGLAYSEDLSQLVARGVETTIQGMWVDNGANGFPVNILIEGTGQLITVPSNAQGIFPVFFTGAPSFQITCGSNTNNVATRVILLNVPPNSSGFWKTNQ